MKNLDYSKIRNFTLTLLLVIAVSWFLVDYELPYYIYAPGGSLNANDRITVQDSSYDSGEVNLLYATQIRATPITYGLSLLLKEYDIEPFENVVMENETEEIAEYRSKLMLETASQAAIVNAYNEAAIDYQLLNTYNHVVYLHADVVGTLTYKDRIVKANGITISSKEDYIEVVENSEIGDIITIEVNNDGEVINRTIQVQMIEGYKSTGIYFITEYEIESDTKVDFTFEEDESGPSGGAMTALAIYDKLIEEDITNGLQIAGTGTIDGDGNVGEIGGIKYKLLGIQDEDFDIIFIPEENYEEAKKIINEFDLDLTVVAVSTFEEILNYLEN